MKGLVCPEGLAVPALQTGAMLAEVWAASAIRPRAARRYQHAAADPRRRIAKRLADHRVVGGVPCIRGTRIPVATVVGLLAQGRSIEGILADYPQLSTEDVRAALAFAAAAVSERYVPLRTSA
jgi:uncharacterized protein (DUF433 family)